MQIINDYITANEKQLKRLCFKFFKGGYLWEDLFQEIYLRLIEVPEEKIQKNNLGAICYTIALSLYRNRNRKHSCLKTRQYLELSENHAFTSGEYLNDIYDFIDNELNKKHGFADLLVFIQAQDESIREISRKTKLSPYTLRRYYKMGQLKLQRLLT